MKKILFYLPNLFLDFCLYASIIFFLNKYLNITDKIEYKNIWQQIRKNNR